LQHTSSDEEQTYLKVTARLSYVLQAIYRTCEKKTRKRTCATKADTFVQNAEDEDKALSTQE